jgi:excinuclease ABC subunit A
MGISQIIIRGARVHNLQNIHLELPRDRLIVITGLSGSGKSSLAFDTLYAEGQRRYLESLSTYARQFIGEIKKPDVDDIEGLSPTIAITQHAGSRNPRSTVGTMTEIYDYLRLLFARTGVPHCPVCGDIVKSQSIDEMLDDVMERFNDQLITICAPVAMQKKGEFKNLFTELQKKGFIRIMVDGTMYELEEPPELDKNKKHTLSVVLDRIQVEADERSRLAESLEQSIKLSQGLVEIRYLKKGKETSELLSEAYACLKCNVQLPAMEPRLFSFNSPLGACSKCDGLGVVKVVDEHLIVPDESLSIFEGAIKIPGFRNIADSFALQWIEKTLKRYHESSQTPFKDLNEKTRETLLFGDEHFEGLTHMVERRYRETTSDMMIAEYDKLMQKNTCPQCLGKRLKAEALAVTVAEQTIHDLCCLSLRKLKEFIEGISFSNTQWLIAERIIKEISLRLSFIINVGLDYLSLSREAATLSGGEAQRLRLASQVGSGLVGVMYVLDEPSIGLHPRDNEKLLKTLLHLRDTGNTVIVVEHDEDTIRLADHLVDIGPGAGIHGGTVVASGTVEDIISNPASITGQYLSGKQHIPTPSVRRKGNGAQLKLLGASANNIESIDVSFPLGVLIGVTGVSGSGKSTLVNDILYEELHAKIQKKQAWYTKVKEIKGIEHIERLIIVDQNPIGRTPRSNPATYIGLWTEIRKIFEALPESKIRGYKMGRFSFNVKGGRCEACQGDGLKKVEMQFLPDVYVPCEVCQGKRFNRETLEVRFKGYNIAELLELTVDETLTLFGNFPNVNRKLTLLQEVGLGYIKLGQSSTTLSGGEAQRIKLAYELSKKTDGKAFYILDEPTTGLHFADIKMLMAVLNRLVDLGNTVLVIEHHLDVIKCADYLVDLGPGGGEFGGKLVSSGSPEKIMQHEASFTGQFLKKHLEKEKAMQP